MNKPKANAAPLTSQSAQSRGPLPLHFRRRGGRVVVQAIGDHSLRQNPRSNTKRKDGTPWCPRVEREKPHPAATSATKQVGNTLATVITTADGTPYAAMESGAVRRLTHVGDELEVRRRQSKVEKKVAKRRARGAR